MHSQAAASIPRRALGLILLRNADAIDTVHQISVPLAHTRGLSKIERNNLVKL